MCADTALSSRRPFLCVVGAYLSAPTQNALWGAVVSAVREKADPAGRLDRARDIVNGHRVRGFSWLVHLDRTAATRGRRITVID